MPVLTIPASAVTSEVAYIDADGMIKTTTATQITSTSNRLESGWYYVSGSTTITPLVENSYTSLIVQGDVHLILTDNCTLNLNAGVSIHAGIEVPYGYMLSIYAQSEGENTGRLVARSDGDGAAIGSRNGFDAGTINIFGGHITVTATGTGAAIGGGHYGSGETINITGGTVKANSSGSGAAIGGGSQGHGGTINISGGTIEAGGSFGAGIGGGTDGAGGVINISGGTVTASSANYGAGIGSGGSAVGGTIRISGGKVTAGGANGAGIGGGSGGSNSAVHISGGTVIAESKQGAGIGGGTRGDGGIVLISGGTVTARGTRNPSYEFGGAGIGGGTSGGGSGGNGATVIITGGSVVAESMYGEPIGKGSSGSDSGTLTNGTADVHLTKVTLSDVNTETEVRSVSGPPYNYGTSGMKTDASGTLYLYLPVGSAVTDIETEENSYRGSVSAGREGTMPVKLAPGIISSVSLPGSGDYTAGQSLEFNVTYSSNVIVTGTPYIPLTVGGDEKQAVYTSGSGTATLVFRYTIRSGDLDTDGIDVGSSILLNSGTIKAEGEDAQLNLGDTGHLENVIVLMDSLTVTISSSASNPTSFSSFTATITFSERVTGFTKEDLEIVGGSLPLFSSLITDDDITFTISIYISYPSEGVVTVAVPAGAVRGSEGTTNSASNQLSIVYDTVRPRITEISLAEGDVNVPVSGDIVLRFNEPMRADAFSIMLQGSMLPQFLDGTWSNGNQTYTVQYRDLSYSQTYTISINSFSLSDPAGNMLDGGSLSISFTTEPEPQLPSVSPRDLTVAPDETVSFSVTLGQGSAVATQATISVGDSSKISVSPSSITVPGTVTVTGLAPGTSEITVSFNNSANTTETVLVTVYTDPPSWPVDSRLIVSDLTHSTLDLTWTAASGPNEVVGYRIYKDGVLIGTVNGSRLSYTVTGLAPSTAYSFQVQAGDEYDLWSTNGPVISTTTEPEPRTPSVAPIDLTVAPGETESFSVTFGQGSSAATQATVSVGDSSKISVTSESLTAPGTVAVTGLALGTTEITVSFNDSANTTETVRVTVYTEPPSWSGDSRLIVSNLAHSTLDLTWTAASGPYEVIEYRVYKDGVLIGSVDGSRLSYTVTGLAPSTAYSFQIQAGNEYDLWSTNGPVVSAATSIPASPGGSSDGSTLGSASEALVITGDGRVESIRVITSGGSASADLTDAHSRLLAEGRSVTVSLPEVGGVTEYSLNIPASGLTGNGSGEINVITDAGSVRLPSDMLTRTAMASTGTATFTISRVGSSELPESVLKEVGTRPVISLSLSIDGKRTDWNNPNGPVAVSIPYTPTAEELADPDSIVIWYIGGDGRLTCVTNGRYIPETGTVSFTTSHFSHYAVGYNAVSFMDVSDTAWYYDEVIYIAARKITSGTSDVTFSPDAALTRGQFITLLMRAYGIEEEKTPADNFTDAGNTYYTGYLAAAKRLEISNGVGGSKFAPEQNITRQEMFALLYNALKVIGQLPQGDTGRTLDHFTDTDQIDTWAKEAMSFLVKTGIISGNAGKLDPTGATTRAEMAQLLYNLLSKQIATQI